MTRSTNPGPPSESEHASTVANWIAVALITGATLLGGVALVLWNWPLFWTAVGLFAGGIVGAWRGHIMDAVSVYQPPATNRPAAGDPGSRRSGEPSARYPRAS
jgi:hypothetical protein